MNLNGVNSFGFVTTSDSFYENKELHDRTLQCKVNLILSLLYISKIQDNVYTYKVGQKYR